MNLPNAGESAKAAWRSRRTRLRSVRTTEALSRWRWGRRATMTRFSRRGRTPS